MVKKLSTYKFQKEPIKVIKEQKKPTATFNQRLFNPVNMIELPQPTQYNSRNYIEQSFKKELKYNYKNNIGNKNKIPRR